MTDNDEMFHEIERIISLRLMQEDVETIYSLMNTERDPIFSMAVMPYYALFVQSCQEYMGDTYIEDAVANKTKDIRNYIKAFADGYSKSRKRIASVNDEQDLQFRSHLRFDFMKSWNIHDNLGTYWTDNKHIIGNTQMYADYLGVNNIFDHDAGKKQYEVAYQFGSFVNSISKGLSELTPPVIHRDQTGIVIKHFCDLNTFKDSGFFKNNTIELNMFYLNLACNMNFVKHVLSPLLSDLNPWLFRIKYIVTYYTYRALQRLKNYCDINSDISIDKVYLSTILEMGNGLFETKFRNCMMHYGLENQGVLSLEYIEKPFYGLIETCFNGMSLNEYLGKLSDLEESIINYLESQFDSNKIELKDL